MAIKGRTFVRRQGCWSCIHWENGDPAKQHWDACKAREMGLAQIVKLQDPRGTEAPQYKQIVTAIAQKDIAMAKGTYGLCYGGGVQSDFVHHAHLCAKWSGRQGASVARDGGLLDPLPDELKDKLDGSD